MRQPTTTQGWIVFAVALFVIGAWAADPRGQLPVLPPQLGYGVGDDPKAVEARDAQVRHYDELSSQGGWMRTRLALKVAGDPLNPASGRQLLLALVAITVFAVWRSGDRAS